MKTVYLLFLTFITSTLFAQQNFLEKSQYALVYQLTEEQAMDFVINYEDDFLQEIWKTTPIDTLFDFSKSTPNYGKGHFLMVYTKGEYLEYDYFSNPTIGLIPINDKKQFRFYLIDSIGNMIEADKVKLENRAVKYNAEKQYYYTRKFKDYKFLIVDSQGEKVFFEVERDEPYYNRYRKNRSIKERLNDKWENFQYKKEEKSYHKKKQAFGYITTNKPKYRPNDTLKVKAYITNEKGKPYDIPLELRIFGYDEMLFKTIEASPKGNYEFEMPLKDSLKLDKKYWVKLYDGDNRLLSTEFRYEDYELDETVFTLRVDKEQFGRNEPIVFYASAKTTNGLSVLDGSVEITAKINKIDKFIADKMLIVDTLFHYKGQFEINQLDKEEMRFVIPKSAIPDANFSINLSALFTNSNGELQRKQMTLNVEQDSFRLDARFVKDTLIIDYLENEQSISQTANLILTLPEIEYEIKKTIQLPYKAPLNPVFKKVIVTTENAKTALSNTINSYDFRTPFFEMTQTEDSVFIYGFNRSNLTVHYDIFRLNQKIATEKSNDYLIIWKDKTNKKTSYRIDYQYIFEGKGIQESQRLSYGENMLNIDIQQPENIQPGETVDVNINIKTAKNKAAKNVHVVAGSVNKQFEDTTPYEYFVPFKGKKSKSNNRQNYNSRSDNKYDIYLINEDGWRKKITKEVAENLDIKGILYYDLLLADSSFYQSQKVKNDTLQKFAQFAPFVVKNGKFQPVYLIYANQKLVYYYDTEMPYSFVGESGENDITIRGKDFEITVDNVDLEKGKKLYFSINLDNLPSNATLINKTVKWTKQEQSLLEKSIFSYRKIFEKHDLYLWQNDIVYSANIKESRTNFGPFEANDSLHLVLKKGFKKSIIFQPNYFYEIEKGNDKLYRDKEFPIIRPLDEKYEFKVKLNDTLSFNKNIEIHKKKVKSPLIARQVMSIFKEKCSRNYGQQSYVIQKEETLDSSHFAFVFYDKINEKQISFLGYHTMYKDIPKGNYTFYGYTVWGNYFEHQVQIRKDTFLYERLRNLEYKTDSNLVLLKQILNTDTIQLMPFRKSQLYISNITRRISPSIYNSSITGIVTDETGEPLMFANVALYKNGALVTGVQTDIDGKYSFNDVDIGRYDVEVSYVGYSNKRISDVVQFSSRQTILDIEMTQGVELNVVEVTYSIPLDEDDYLEPLKIITPYELDYLKSKKINGIIAESAGVSSNYRDDDYIEIDGYEPEKESIEPISNIEQNDIFISENTTNTNQNSQIRTNFQDYAFWQPNLITDQNGEATFRVTYPDNITTYETFVIGMGKKYRFGLATKTVKSQKTTLAQLAVPRFLIEGDKSNIIGKSLNYSNDSLRIKSTFLSENNILESNEFWLKNAKIETTQVIANTTKDTLLLAYKIESNQLFDGEKRPIPIYKKGIEETIGTFHILENDTTLSLNFDLSKGNVKLYARTDILDVLLEDIQYLIDYPYGCNEQTASRLIALLMNDKIQKTTNKNYQNSKGKTANRQAILKMVKRLENTQNADGSWGWWSGNKVNYWMTNYVLKALHAADTSGYKSASYEKGLRFIVNSIDQIKPYQLLNSVEIISETKLNMDYEKYLNKIQSEIRYNDYYNQLRIIKIKQEQGLEYDLLVLDSLENQTTFGNIFYKSNSYYRWYSNQQNLTQLAYAIIKNENPSDKRLAAIRGYFLEKRTRYGWRNTFTTAQILSTILPDFANVSNRIKPKLVIKGNTTETVTEFPFETTFYANTPLEIQKTGTSTVYLTGYQQFWNEKPKTKNDIFELKSKLVQNGKTVKKLKSKTPAKMVVTVEVKKEAEYVMVEVPIPAGCSYGEKSRNYGYWYGREVHREYFREKTCVFYQNLPVGTYTIEINLEPRFTGEYTINPAKAEEMYFPVFYGRNAIKEVEIEEK